MKVGDIVKTKRDGGRVGIVVDITFNIYKHMIIHVMYADDKHKGTYSHYTHEVEILKQN